MEGGGDNKSNKNIFESDSKKVVDLIASCETKNLHASSIGNAIFTHGPFFKPW